MEPLGEPPLTDQHDRTNKLGPTKESQPSASQSLGTQITSHFLRSREIQEGHRKRTRRGNFRPSDSFHAKLSSMYVSKYLLGVIPL